MEGVRTADLGERSGRSTMIVPRGARGDENGEDQPPRKRELAGNLRVICRQFFFLLAISPLRSPQRAAQ